MNDFTFDKDAWDEYISWQEQDRKTIKRINKLIEDIQRNGPMQGIMEALNIPYTGADISSSTLYMSKLETKAICSFVLASHMPYTKHHLALPLFCMKVGIISNLVYQVYFKKLPK